MNIDINLLKLGQKIERRTANVAIIGFGYIGAIIGAIIAESGFKVIGIDIDKSHLDNLINGESNINEPGFKELLKTQLNSGRLQLSADFSNVKDSDIVIVTVGTPKDALNHSDLGDFTNALESVAPYISDQQAVIIKSTVPPLTTEHIAFDKLYRGKYDKNEVLFAFCPERIALGNAIGEFKSIPIIVGGMNAQSTSCVGAFFKMALGVDVVATSRPRTAEMVKLADNLWIDLNIAMANELAMLSDSLGIDVLEIIKASNTLAKGSNYVNILMPSVGVGGSCLPKDPHFLVEIANDLGISLKTPLISRAINDSMPAYSVSRINSALKLQNKSLKDCSVGVLGIAYKNNTGDCRESPAGPFIGLLKAQGALVKVYDPYVSNVEAQRVTDLPLEHDLNSTLSDIDCLAFLTGHQQFKEIDIDVLIDKLKPGTVVFDGRMYFQNSIIERFKDADLKYIGIGR
ncbi:MAG: nucleotide sugar dehydrogenase [Bacteroidetes bacterium]|nr:nucleotide sugar dehydrogenase [Bacteroidota bacterium]